MKSTKAQHLYDLLKYEGLPVVYLCLGEVEHVLLCEENMDFFSTAPKFVFVKGQLIRFACSERGILDARQER